MVYGILYEGADDGIVLRYDEGSVDDFNDGSTD